MKFFIGNVGPKSRDFWSGQIDPMHRSSNKDYLDAYGKELYFLIEKKTFKSVLEYGCGSGTFFKRLKFDNSNYYLGVDFSESMLETFRVNFPFIKRKKNVRLVCDDASTFFCEKKFDMIFSNGMVQHLTKKMFKLHLKNSLSMLNDGGSIVIASIPWRSQFFSYFSGESGSNPLKASVLKAFWSLTYKSSWLNGRWYSCKEVAIMANYFGLNYSFFGSLHYPYRMHVVLTKTH